MILRAGLFVKHIVYVLTKQIYLSVGIFLSRVN